MKFTINTIVATALLMASAMPTPAFAKEASLRKGSNGPVPTDANANANAEIINNPQRSRSLLLRSLPQETYVAADSQIAFIGGPDATSALGSSIIITGNMVDSDEATLIDPAASTPTGTVYGTSSQVCITTATGAVPATDIAAHQCTITDEFFASDGSSLGSVIMQAGGKYDFTPGVGGELPPSFEAAVIGGTGLFDDVTGSVLIETMRERTGTFPTNLSGFIVLRHNYDNMQYNYDSGNDANTGLMYGPCEITFKDEAALRAGSTDNKIEMKLAFDADEAELDFSNSGIPMTQLSLTGGKFNFVARTGGNSMQIKKKNSVMDSAMLTNSKNFIMQSVPQMQGDVPTFQLPTCRAVYKA